MSDLKWEKTGRSINSEGTTITYRGAGTNLIIESRKRHIPHANGRGTWDHTSYFVLLDGKDLVEKQTLAAAKKWAEAMFAEVKGWQDRRE